ncbi:YveK family protein [Fictibacillus nanhaiensis]|uniref:YveK family protein n=1 Tax=Fictibacillus nanhaiensis TaxID=742169 RepID=UPI003C1759EE
MEETISLKDIFQTIKKRLFLIGLITIIAVAISGIISYFVLTPIYQSSTQILVNQSKNEQQVFDVNQVRTNVEMINTYSVIIKSPTILGKVAENLKLDKTTDQLNSQVTVNSEQNSQVFTITVEDPDPAMAVKIANNLADTFQKEIPEIMSIDNVSVLSKAALKENPSPINPKPFLNMAIALVVGLMAGVGLAFLFEYLDNTIKNEQDIEALLGLPVLGVIPKITVGDEKAPINTASRARMGSGTLES